MSSTAVQLHSVELRYTSATLKLPDVEIAHGERVLLRGPSGAGKSSLLRVVAGLLKPHRGRVQVLNTDLLAQSVVARDRLRGEHMGMVFQRLNLVPYLSAMQNVLLPVELLAARRARLGGWAPREVASALLDQLEVGAERDRPADQLSVGQQQRVAVARALIGRPELILLDEPTAALDPERTEAFIALLLQVAAQDKPAIVLATHNPQLGPGFDRELKIDGLAPAGT